MSTRDDNFRGMLLRKLDSELGRTKALQSKRNLLEQLDTEDRAKAHEQMVRALFDRHEGGGDDDTINAEDMELVLASLNAGLDDDDEGNKLDLVFDRPPRMLRRRRTTEPATTRSDPSLSPQPDILKRNSTLPIRVNMRVDYSTFKARASRVPTDRLLQAAGEFCDISAFATKSMGIKHAACEKRPHDPSSLTLRLLHVNDVYGLERLPSLMAAMDRYRRIPTCDRVVASMGGDFLAPYVLSMLDRGAGMVDCMNRLKFDYCCFGNHECDVPHSSLLAAIDKFEGTWLNSNMKGGGSKDYPESFGDHARLPTSDVLELASADGSQNRRVALLGLLTNARGLYRPGAFNGAAASIEEVNSCCRRLCQELREKCDIVIPMTHQDSREDEELALEGRDLRIPVILGGHDHTICKSVPDDSPGAAWLVKAGMDAAQLAVVDLTWPSADCEWPQVTVQMIATSAFDPDPTIDEAVIHHMMRVWTFKYMIFLVGEDDMEDLVKPGTEFPFSSMGTRYRESSMATLLCTALRDASQADACLLDGGSVRANQDSHGRLSGVDLRNLLPFTNSTVTVELPGQMLSDAVQESRTGATSERPNAFFLHGDNCLIVDNKTHQVTHVKGKPLELDRTYNVALGNDLGIGYSGKNEALHHWALENPEAIPQDAARPAKDLLELYFMQRVLMRLPPFDDMDEDEKGFLTMEDLAQAYTQNLTCSFSKTKSRDNAAPQASLEMARLLVGACDPDGEGRIGREAYDHLVGG